MLNALVGFAGLTSTVAALRAGRRLALANKESLVAGGDVVMQAWREGGGEIVPVDSEHSAIHQCIGERPHEEVRRLHRAVRTVMRKGIANRGASFSDYVDARGEEGGNAERLFAYRRTGEPCLRCGREIQRIVVGQRSTHFCPRCQPLPEPEPDR